MTATRVHMPRRPALTAWLIDAIGPAATLVSGRGWPAVVDLADDSGRRLRVAIHLANVTPMNRRGGERLEDRPDELRIQNPADSNPPTAPSGTIPLLTGVLPSLDGDPPVLVLADDVRFGGQRRFSVCFPGSVAYEAAVTGYEHHTSSDDEQFVAISPPALPAVVFARQRGVVLEPISARTAIQAAGPVGSSDTATKERVRVATTRLVRSATFRRDVLDAWGEQCAFCDLTVDLLLEAAHVYPVELAGSRDEISNGLPVCLHHHRLFDRHRLHLDPQTLAVSVHPSLTALTADSIARALASITRATVPIPAAVDAARVSAWLEQRYAAYPRSYDWAPRR